MILCFSQDDFKIVEEAYKKNKYPKDIFGIPYCYLKDHSLSGLLSKNENLFITAHGNNQEIGNKNEGLSFNASQLATFIKSIIPGGFTGSIYVSACDTAPVYSTNLKNALHGSNINVPVYGCRGAINLDIAAPGNAMWVRA